MLRMEKMEIFMEISTWNLYHNHSTEKLERRCGGGDECQVEGCYDRKNGVFIEISYIITILEKNQWFFLCSNTQNSGYLVHRYIPSRIC